MSSNWHHRMARSHGGKSENGNRVRVDARRHALWHFMFDNLPGDQIVRLINDMFLLNRCTKRLRVYWYFMFGRMTLEQAFEEINAVWLDPRYKVYLIPIEPSVMRESLPTALFF